MPVSVRIDLNDAQNELRRLGQLDDLKVPLRRSGVYMERQIGLRFRKADWQPLSPATLKLHPHRVGGKPLNDTGKLKMSVTSQAIKRVSSKKLQYGTNLIYAPLHNFGGKGWWNSRVPKREFLYFDQKNERAIKRIFEDYIKELSE